MTNFFHTKHINSANFSSKLNLAKIQFGEVDLLTRMIALLFVLGVVFSNSQLASADGGHGDKEEEVTEETEEVQEGSSSSEEGTDSSDSHQDDEEDHSKQAEEHNKQAEEHKKQAEEHSKQADGDKEVDHADDEDDHAEEEGDDGHHGPVVETPPNFIILGTFGAVNLGFILIGVWNKWIRRKGE